MEREVIYKNNSHIEARKRIDMAYLLLKSPKMIETIEKTKAAFFHGTNANALPSILKYGINSADESIKRNININTGEGYFRAENGARNFVSLTDCLDSALTYANMSPNDNTSINQLLNFGVVIGTSFENMDDIRTCRVHSDISEFGVVGNLPLDHIKFLAVSEDKVEFVKKMVGEKSIDVISMDIKDKFYKANYKSKLDMLEKGKEDLKNETYPTYLKEDVKPMVNERKPSGIRGFFEVLKAKWKTENDKNISGRG